MEVIYRDIFPFTAMEKYFNGDTDTIIKWINIIETDTISLLSNVRPEDLLIVHRKLSLLMNEIGRFKHQRGRSLHINIPKEDLLYMIKEQIDALRETMLENHVFKEDSNGELHVLPVHEYVQLKLLFVKCVAWWVATTVVHNQTFMNNLIEDALE